MKAALFVLLSIAAALPTQAAFGNGYSFRRSIVIDHTKVPNTDQIDFPVLVSGTYSYLATVANGGLVTNGSGFDIIFTSDLAGTTPLAYDRERYVATTGESIFWVRVPTVATAADTTIYMFYANAAISTDQSNSTGTWASSYAGVYHLPNGTALTTNDSTSNANNAAGAATAFAEVGTIDGGMACNGSSSSMNVTNNASINFTDFSVEMWLNWGNFSASFEQVLRKGGAWGFFIDGSNKAGLYINADTTLANVWSPATNTNYHVVATYVNSTKAVNLYINGALFNTRTTATTMTPNTTNMFFCSNDTGGQFAGVHLDEMRFSNVARSADYAATAFNSESSPATFYTVGAQTTSGGTAAATLILL